MKSSSKLQHSTIAHTLIHNHTRTHVAPENYQHFGKQQAEVKYIANSFKDQGSRSEKKLIFIQACGRKLSIKTCVGNNLQEAGEVELV